MEIGIGVGGRSGELRVLADVAFCFVSFRFLKTYVLYLIALVIVYFLTEGSLNFLQYLYCLSNMYIVCKTTCCYRATA